MNGEKTQDEKAYQKLGVLVWGSLIQVLFWKYPKDVPQINGANWHAREHKCRVVKGKVNREVDENSYLDGIKT